MSLEGSELAGMGSVPTGAGAPAAAAPGGLTGVASGSPYLGVTTLAGIATLTQNIIADWTIGNLTRRYFLIDGTNGNDANAGYTDTLPATAATTAKKTIAGFRAIFPVVGGGRTVEIVVAAGTDIAGIDQVLNGASGYATASLLRGTGTNATANATAFAGNAADIAYMGFAPAAGMNAAGYNPTVAGSVTTITCQTVAAGAPGFPAETAIPLCARIRFDAATTTVALRNKVIPIIAVPASNQLAIAAANTVALADIFYIETAGVTCSTTLTLGAVGATGNAMQIAGVSGTLLTIRNGQYTLAGCAWSSSVTGSNNGFLSCGSTVSAVASGVAVTQTVGGTRCASSVSITSGSFTMSSGNCILGTLTTSNCILSITDDVVLSSHTCRGGIGDLVNPGFQWVGGTARPVRFVGGASAFRTFSTNLGLGKLSIVGATYAVWLFPDGTNQIYITDAVTGACTDRAIDLTDSWDTKIRIYGAAPTVTGTNGDIKMNVATSGSPANACYAPNATLDLARLGGIVDLYGNEILNNPGALAPRKLTPYKLVGVLNNSGGTIAQYTLVKVLGGGPTMALALADTAPHASGQLAFVVTPAPNNTRAIVALSGNMLPVIFDGAVAAGDVAYLSDVNAGQVKVGAPANARALGNVMIQRDGTNCISFEPPPG